MARMGLFEKVTLEKRSEGEKGRSHADVRQARCIRGTLRRPGWLEWVGEEKSRT